MQKQNQIPWHTLDEQTAMDRLQSTKNGLASAEISKRLEHAGRNTLGEAKKKSSAAIFLDQFRDFMIGVLLVAAAVSAFIGEPKDTITIIVIVVLNAVIGFVQEYRSEQAMEALRGMSAPRATVIRDGKQSIVAAAGLVPGDMVIIDAGAVVPADLRLLETTGLMIDESAMTGESVPVEKNTAVILNERTALGDRLNLAYSGTIAVGGHGVGVVIATGPDSQLGQIAGLVEAGEMKTPLQKRLARFGRTLALVILAVSAVVFAAGIIRGTDPTLMLLTAISLAVAAIPEALPAVVTISLALGAQQLAKNEALIRRLPAVETLGAVTFICSDKTGTLTKNEMTVTELFINGRLWSVGGNNHGFKLTERGGSEPRETQAPPLFLAGLICCNNATVHMEEDRGPVVIGDPTEGALIVLAAKAGLPIDGPVLFPRVGELPFDSTRKRMTTIHQAPAEKRRSGGLGEYPYISFTKGAFDVLFPRVNAVWSDDKIVDLGAGSRAAIERASEKMAADGLRVLALTCRFWKERPDVDPDLLEDRLILLGLTGIMDPPRNEAIAAVKICREAGITPVMITGDHPATAKRIAQDLGIALPGARVVTGTELQTMNEADFIAVVESVRVYARVAPEDKIKIVRALQGRGEIVAMTGDGVNDAPALKAADIGVAMGVTGTDVAKEAADLVLLDDNFATIVRAVAGGRRIYDNIRRFIKYTLTSNTAEILVMFLAPFIGLPFPFLPIHILWINLVTDGLPGLALAVEPPESRLMAREPRDPRESIFSRGLWQHLIWVGLLMAGVSLFSQAWWLQYGGAWRTVIFSVLALSQMGHALAVRSETDSLFTLGLFSNLFLLGSVVLTLVLQLLIIYTPFLQDLFRTQALSPTELALVLGLSSVVFFAVEIEKAVKRRLLKGA
jgi:Ca2+-transporting ATPase